MFCYLDFKFYIFTSEINQIHTENQAMSKEIEDLRAETGSEQQKQIESLLEENSYGW